MSKKDWDQMEKDEAPVTCKCAAHSYAECICGAWDDLNPHTLKRERDEAVSCLREAIAEAGPYYDDPRCPQRGKDMIARWRKAAGIDTANTPGLLRQADKEEIV